MKIKNILSKGLNINKASLVGLALVFSVSFIGAGIYTQNAYAHPHDNPRAARAAHENKVCGTGNNHVHTKFDIGCDQTQPNPIMDMTFSIIRFLSVGVGIVVIASIIFAGIQYSTSQGNPEKTAQAKGRVQDSVMALIFYLFIFAIVQYLVPGGLFN